MKLRSVALAALLFVGLPLASSSAFIGISVGIAPPPLPVYVQPPCPVQGHLWTPGYWSYADFGYYWVPGVWVAPPRLGVYWTPGYWGYNGGSYAFNSGYWGPSVGFYGGINYGYGYGGNGYHGGQWAGNVFRYNTAVTRVNTNIVKNVYINKKVVNNYGPKPGGASFNGPKGVKAQPNPEQQRLAANAEKVPPTPEQQKVEKAAAKNPEFHANKNGGKPKMAALNTPDEIERQPSGADNNPGQRGDKAPKAGNDAQQAAAAGAPDSENEGRKGAKGANSAKAGDNAQQDAIAGGARKKDGEKDADALNDGATAQGREAEKSRQQRADGMPDQAADPNLPETAKRGRAPEAIADRGPQSRPDQSVTRSKPATRETKPTAQRPARTNTTAESRRLTPEEAAAQKRKRAKEKRPERGF